MALTGMIPSKLKSLFTPTLASEVSGSSQRVNRVREFRFIQIHFFPPFFFVDVSPPERVRRTSEGMLMESDQTKTTSPMSWNAAILRVASTSSACRTAGAESGLRLRFNGKLLTRKLGTFLSAKLIMNTNKISPQKNERLQQDALRSATLLHPALSTCTKAETPANQ